MRDAQGTRAPIQALADKVSAIFVPVVIALAIVTFVAWFLAVHLGGAPVATALVRAFGWEIPIEAIESPADAAAVFSRALPVLPLLRLIINPIRHLQREAQRPARTIGNH